MGESCFRLPREFYARSPRVVARDLLGKWLVHERPGGIVRGRIVETEAYLGPEDAASHARFGPTSRTRRLWGPPGHAYVFLVYGLHRCLNVVTGPEGVPGVVLFRALELDPEPGERLAASGPGRLTRALHVDLRHDGADLVAGALYVEDRGGPPPRVGATPRIGVDYAGAWATRPLRFVDRDSDRISPGPRLTADRSPATRRRRAPRQG